MKRRRIPYSEAELSWLSNNRTLPRAEMREKFVKKFNREDVSQENLEGLCLRKDWTTGRCKKGIKPIGWTADQLAFVEANSKIPRSELYTKFVDRFGPTDITLKNLQSLCSQKGWRCRKKHRSKIIYSDVELAWIKDNCELPRTELHAKFVCKFKRTDVEIHDLKSLCTRKGWKTGRTGCFEKGSVSWNKGKKGYHAPGSEKGWFKKGQVPPNRKPFGHERVCPKDGYILIKVDMDHPHFPGRRGYYMAKQRYLYEQEHGPIPKGMVLRCLDGDKLNVDLDNWELITQALNARLNQRGYNDVPDDLKPAAMTSAKIVDKLGKLKVSVG